MAKKFYTVWSGLRPGVYNSWAECEAQTKGVSGAKFKSFPTREFAEQAFSEGAALHYGNQEFLSALSPLELQLIGKPEPESLSVDAACNSFTGEVEWRGVMTGSGKQVFASGPYEQGSVNLGEFVAIVDGLRYCAAHQLPIPIYSDSRNAIMWVRDKAIHSNVIRTVFNKELFKIVDTAVADLNANAYPNKILKWETEAWGENPADFGRK